MGLREKTLALILTAVLLISACMPFFGLSVEDVTEMNKRGIVVTGGSNLNVRNEPGTNGTEIIFTLPKDSIVDVTGSVKISSGEEWYRIKANGREGYVLAKYITLRDIPADSDEAFEEEISVFSESYKESLRELHILHPNWKFYGLETGISWAELTKNEYLTGRNLIQTPQAWMSYEKGAYDWTNGKWYSFDSGNWVQACREAIDYYLDPRNFLDNTSVYQFLVLSYDGSEYSVEAVDAMLKGSFMYQAECGDGMTYAEALIKAGKEAGTSPYMLAGRIKMEQGSSGNKLAHGTVSGYEGYYNHFDIGAYAANGNSAMVNGAIYAKKKGWDTPYKALLGGAEFLAKNYIKVGQNTMYLQKYDVVDGGNGFYNHQYMTNIGAAASEGAVLRKGIAGTSAEESALSFLIPVYTDMPEENSPMPLKTGSANNLLASLTPSEGEFTVDFDKYTQEYDLFTDKGEITLSATAIDSEAEITGTGKHTLYYGVNEIEVKVKATNGCTRIYTVAISTTYEGNGTAPTPTPTPPTSPDTTPTPTPTVEKSFECDYTVEDGYIKGVLPQTSIADFKGKLRIKGYTAVFKDASGKEKSASDNMKTGDVLSLCFGNTEEKRFSVVIYGDVNCDGKLNSADLLATQRYILGLAQAKNEAANIAADFNKDGKVNSRDLLSCQRKILGLS